MFKRRNKQDPLYWARGRLVAIRPDGARRSFDPEASMVLRTDEEREQAAALLSSLYARVLERGADLRPPWLTG